MMKLSIGSLTLLGLLSTMGAFGEGFAPFYSHGRQHDPSAVGQNQAFIRTIARGGAAPSESYNEILPVYDAKTVSSFDKYKKIHAASIANPSKYWGDLAKADLDWMVPFDDTKVLQGDLTKGDVRWFAGGKLNVAYNALDRHDPDALALIWEGDEPNDIRKLTFGEMSNKVSQIANALKAKGVMKGDVVTIYMPMIPELAMTMLACAKIGAVHSVVFAGFSAEALASRIQAAKSEVLITADHGLRGGKNIALKYIVDQAMEHITDKDLVKNVLVWEREYKEGSSEAPYQMKPKDVRMDPLVADQRPYCAPEPMDAEDNLFILYTSGSTGMPKGLVHTTGGYALFAKHTTKTTFDLAPGDIFACVADCGWITGHSYVVYGPLLNGATTFMFESTPVYPDEGRYWDMIQRHKITQFYTAPTAIRLLMRYGDEPPSKYDLSSLKVLGSVGEPINPEAWRWYYEVVGRSECTVVDTYWQTETGGHIVTNLPGVTPMKPGSCTLPFYGVDAVVLDPATGHIVEPDATGRVEGVMAVRQPWPGMARTCLGDHARYMTVYLKPYPGYYFTGDSVQRDEEGNHFITGRVDDVINVSGHRIGTAEVESALVAHPGIAQAAVVGKPHDIKGQAICAFVMLRNGYEESDDLIQELRLSVRSEVGSFCSPDMIIVTPSLPMTRSGKIMRRILRKIVAGETDTLGDTSTLADPSIVDTLIDKVGISDKAKSLQNA
ncbi:acetyl-coenzyme a synthetase [Nitzschia inconspicua]|uniref:Acetyl-coenzyme A synthetase n=1 Tax=Nitzschia inconspicua TaxID=303405 RepID=A0A9K3KHX6_9STRA|nr:acetyl-coenzyme a synthetase [Nitzschia inconspicua]